MVFTDDITDNAGRLLVGLVVIVTEHAHSEQDTTMHGFEAITDVGQRPTDDDTHRVIKVGLLHLLFETYRQQFLSNFSHKYSQYQRDPGHRTESFLREKPWVLSGNNS